MVGAYFGCKEDRMYFTTAYSPWHPVIPTFLGGRAMDARVLHISRSTQLQLLVVCVERRVSALITYGHEKEPVDKMRRV